MMGEARLPADKYHWMERCQGKKYFPRQVVEIAKNAADRNGF
jgi:hypothetical protein